MTTPLSLHIGDLPPLARVRALPHPTQGRRWASRERAAAAARPRAPEAATRASHLTTRQKLEKSRREKTIEFQLIFAAAFLVFFVTSALSRLSPQRFVSQQFSAQQKSIFVEAREAASISAVYAFMG